MDVNGPVAALISVVLAACTAGSTPVEGTGIQPVGTTSPDDEVAVFHPDMEVEDGRASLDLTFTDGTSARISWPADLELASKGVFLEAVGYVQTPGGHDGRILAIHHGPLERIADNFGEGTLLGEYPGADGSTVGFWRFPDYEWDYLVYQFGDWVVMVYDYRELAEERMSEEERSMWARSLTGEETGSGYLLLRGTEPLHVGGPDFTHPPEITLSSQDGDIRLEATACEPDERADNWCDPSQQIRISVPDASAEFEQLARDNLVVNIATG